MKIGNLLLIITGTMSTISLVYMTFLAMFYQEHTSVFHLVLITFIFSAISFMSLYAIKKEN